MVAADQAPDMWRHGSDAIRLWGSPGPPARSDRPAAGRLRRQVPARPDGAYCIYKGRVFGLPHTTDTSALFYREDALEAIGVKPPTDAQGRLDLAAVRRDQRQAARGSSKQQYAFTHNQGAGRWVPSFLYSTGGKVVNDDFTKMAFNTPGGDRGADVRQELVRQEVGAAGHLDHARAERGHRPVRAWHGLDGDPRPVEHHLPGREHQEHASSGASPSSRSAKTQVTSLGGTPDRRLGQDQAPEGSRPPSSSTSPRWTRSSSSTRWRTTCRSAPTWPT